MTALQFRFWELDGARLRHAVWAVQWNGSEEEARILHIREGGSEGGSALAIIVIAIAEMDARKRKRERSKERGSMGIG